MKFSTQISQWFWRMSKTGFQDDSCGSHLRFLISKVLCAFDLQVILLLQCKFQLKPPNGSEADVKIRSSIWWLWWPFWISIPYVFSYFYIYWLACYSIISFNLIGRVVCEDWSKIHFLISTILAIFQIAQLSKIGFQNGSCGGHFGFPIGIILAILLTRQPVVIS